MNDRFDAVKMMQAGIQDQKNRRLADNVKELEANGVLFAVDANKTITIPTPKGKIIFYASTNKIRVGKEIWKGGAKDVLALIKQFNKEESSKNGN